MSGKQLRWFFEDCAWVYSQPKFKENLRKGGWTKADSVTNVPNPSYMDGPQPPRQNTDSFSSLPPPFLSYIRQKWKCQPPRLLKKRKAQLGDPSFPNHPNNLLIIIFLQPKHKSMHPSTHATKHLATVGGGDVAAVVSAAATASVGMRWSHYRRWGLHAARQRRHGGLLVTQPRLTSRVTMKRYSWKNGRLFQSNLHRCKWNASCLQSFLLVYSLKRPTCVGCSILISFAMSELLGRRHM